MTLKTLQGENDIAALYEAGASVLECAQGLGIKKTRAHRQLVALGVSMRPRGRRFTYSYPELNHLSRLERLRYLHRAAKNRHVRVHRDSIRISEATVRARRRLRFFELTQAAAILAKCTPPSK